MDNRWSVGAPRLSTSRTGLLVVAEPAARTGSAERSRWSRPSGLYSWSRFGWWRLFWRPGIREARMICLILAGSMLLRGVVELYLCLSNSWLEGQLWPCFTMLFTWTLAFAGLVWLGWHARRSSVWASFPAGPHNHYPRDGDHVRPLVSGLNDWTGRGCLLRFRSARSIQGR